MAITATQLRALNNRKARPFQQFGQPNSAYTAYGATGCTHTGLQFLAWFVKGIWYTHDQISKMVGYPNQSLRAANYRRGLYPSEVGAFLTKASLPYVVKFGLSTTQVMSIANKLGPVGFGHHYGWVPEWKGYNYFGTVADGRPNGFAEPFGQAGKTQLTGWAGAHFGVYFGHDPVWTSDRARAHMWDPNHNSGSRPEDPPYDRLTTGQFAKVYESYKTILGRTLYAVVPTRAL